jgi:hypothetical protein
LWLVVVAKQADVTSRHRWVRPRRVRATTSSRVPNPRSPLRRPLGCLASLPTLLGVFHRTLHSMLLHALLLRRPWCWEVVTSWAACQSDRTWKLKPTSAPPCCLRGLNSHYLLMPLLFYPMIMTRQNITRLFWQFQLCAISIPLPADRVPFQVLLLDLYRECGIASSTAPLMASVVGMLVLYELLRKLASVICTSVGSSVGFAFTNDPITLPVTYMHPLSKFEEVIRARHTADSANCLRLCYMLQLEVAQRRARSV